MKEEGVWCCKFLCKVTKMKANHNSRFEFKEFDWAVSSYAKLLKWKQITTVSKSYNPIRCCKFLCKVTKMKANHNQCQTTPQRTYAVSSYAKLLKWKQITTHFSVVLRILCCKFLCKVTKMKANHNDKSST